MPVRTPTAIATLALVFGVGDSRAQAVPEEILSQQKIGDTEGSLEGVTGSIEAGRGAISVHNRMIMAHEEESGPYARLRGVFSV